MTGVGGGTLRDLLLDVDVFWIAEPHYLWICVVVPALTWYLAPVLSARRPLLLWADAMGLGLFSVLGCAKALEHGVSDIVAVVMGVLTATFGGLLRDTLLARDTILLGPEMYVSAALAGASSYVLLITLTGLDASLALLVAMIPALVLRAGAIIAGWRLPSYGRFGP